MAQFTIYRSTDTSAPTLSGTAGSLVALLDACLVNGYGSKTAAGWTKPFTGTNKAAFRAGAGNQFYLRVQDDAPGAGGAREARIRGHETMSDVDTGTGLFPTAAQMTNGAFARKSSTADATAREWLIAADDRTVYVFIFTGDLANYSLGFSFGDFYSYVNSDGYRTAIIGNSTENTGTTSQFGALATALSGTLAGHYVARSYLGTGTSLVVGKHTDYVKSQAATAAGSLTSIAFPNPSDGGLFVAPLWIHDPTASPYSIRGTMRGLWCPLHLNTNFASGLAGDTFTGTGDLAGKTFQIIYTRTASLAGAIVLETSNTLLTN